MSRPNQEVVHVVTTACPWVNLGFSYYLSRIRKTYIDIKIRLKNGLLKPILQHKIQIILTSKNLSKIQTSSI